MKTPLLKYLNSILCIVCDIRYRGPHLYDSVTSNVDLFLQNIHIYLQCKTPQRLFGMYFIYKHHIFIITSVNISCILFNSLSIVALSYLFLCTTLLFMFFCV